MAKSPRNAAAGTGIAKLNSPHDAVVKGGHVIDPANNLDGVFDIGIKKGRIAAVAPTLEHGAATRVIDARGLIVTPGLIDTHAHVYEHVSGDFGLNPDLVGIRSGVTTVVDQGGPSALTSTGSANSSSSLPGPGSWPLSRPILPAGSWATAMSISMARSASM